MQKILFVLMVLMMPIAGKAADAGTAAFRTTFSHGGQEYCIRTANLPGDAPAIQRLWGTVTDQEAITPPDKLLGRLEAQQTQIKGGDPFSWMVVEGDGGIEAVLMTGLQPTKAPYDSGNEEHVLFMGLLTKLCGIDYSGGDPKEAKREGNKGLAAMPPAFPPALVADEAKAAAFIEAGFAAVVYLRGQGHVLRDASIPAAVTAIIDPALQKIYEAAGFTVDTEEYLYCLTADRAVRCFAWKSIEEAAAGEASSAAAATTD